MSNWMDDLENADNRKAKAEAARQTIVNLRSSIVSYLVEFLNKEIQVTSQRFFNNIPDLFNVEEARYTNSNSEKYMNDFCVFTNRLPAAYLYVRFDISKPCLTRLLETVNVNNKRRERVLPPLDIKLDDKGEPILELDGEGLDDKGISEALLAPVVMYHKDGR